MNFIAAAVILILFVGIGGVPKASLTLEEVVKDAPAGKVGLVAGDTLVGADGQRWTTWDEASAYFRAHPNETIELTYRPKGEARHAARPSPSRSARTRRRRAAATWASARRRRARAPRAAACGGLGAQGFRDVAVGTVHRLLVAHLRQDQPDGAGGRRGAGRHHQREPPGRAAELVPGPAGLPQLQPRAHEPAADPAVRRRAHRPQLRGAPARQARQRQGSSSA